MSVLASDDVESTDCRSVRVTRRTARFGGVAVEAVKKSDILDADARNYDQSDRAVMV